MNNKNIILVAITSIFIISCSSISKEYAELYGPSAPKNRIVSLEELKSQSYVSYRQEVQPILNQRCAVCHSCNDAPCQLNLTSIAGLDRGANEASVYNGARFSSQEPTRLGVDASNTAQWRGMDFYPVLNERHGTEQANLENSLLYKMLVLKRENPLPNEGRLPKEYDVGTDLVTDQESLLHSQQCTTIDNFEEYAEDHPEWGMPFAFHGLTESEFETIETWLKQGGYAEAMPVLAENLSNEVTKWETFFNGVSYKQKLMSRYIYEHLFLGHLYFDNISNDQFFMLVRSRTPPGMPIDIIASVRPYDDPGTDTFYYRLQRYDRTIVDKTHLPYALSDQRMARYKSLFLEPDYNVNELPGYEKALSANPFKVYADIPAKSRYQFMLDDAQYIIGGFIKGPVCRGSIALSVIDDHFWVVFMDPEKDPYGTNSEFLRQISDDLRIPSEKESDISLLATWTTYSGVVKDYLSKKIAFLRKHFNEDVLYSIDHIWNGNEVNENAALTVYRHYDSATVLKGFVGEVPKTAWVIDYPLLERIHYLLTAGFNVYGKAGHQLSTRLYMDFLRMEAELQYLAFLPSKDNFKIHAHWYRETKKTEQLNKFLEKGRDKIREPNIKYESDDVKTELFIKINRHLKEAQKQIDYINLCTKFADKCEEIGLEAKANATQKALRKLSGIEGQITDVFPNVTFVRIIVDGSIENDLVYTIVRNKSYLNTTSLSASEDTRVKSEDTIDIIKGFVGAYPNFFLQIKYEDLNNFIQQYSEISSLAKYYALVDLYGVRRTNPEFWQVSDWFYRKHQYDNPIAAGLFDLNRYNNR